MALLKDTSHCNIIFALFPAINFHSLKNDIAPLRIHTESNILKLMGETINTEFFLPKKKIPSKKKKKRTNKYFFRYKSTKRFNHQ